MPVTDPMEFACRHWLGARERFHNGSGSAVLDAYLDADQRLLAAFALDWRGSHEALAQAFHAFRQTLIEQQVPTSNELRQRFGHSRLV